ncbi:MAG: type II toxin-antitoxin system VapC family toxin [Cytophagales bacterium]|nr:type II toxin-antitoxin system VapC family toxin [Cytophagales bacterium]
MGREGINNRLVLCDSNIFINIFDNHQPTIDIYKQIGANNVLISDISVMELYKGMRNKTELNRMIKKLKGIQRLHFNDEVSKLATKYIKKYHLSQDLEIPDAIIAASAVRYKLPLFTYNTKDFKFIPGIKLYKS